MHKPWGRLLFTGSITAFLYGLLLAFAAEVMTHFTRTDVHYPLLPLRAKRRAPA